ncbi:MAG TPA: hypothetical protein VIW68_12720 [Candidatus Sulfotelmatobacter sp.]
MADINGLVADPDFQKLDPASQRQALARVSGDNSFTKLSDEGTKQFMGRMAPQQTESAAVASRPGQTAPTPIPPILARPAMPGTALHTVGPQSIALTPAQRESRDAPMQAIMDPARQMARGGQEIGRGQFARGTHDVVAGAGKYATPIALPVAAATAPLATALGVAGGLGGQTLGKVGGEAVGLSPDQADVAGDVLGLAGGYGASRLAPSLTSESVASALRYPATARQSQLGRPGTVKPILPASLQRFMVPDWMIPKGDVGTPTNPGPFMDIPMRVPRNQLPQLSGGSALSVPKMNLPSAIPEGESVPGARGEAWSMKRGATAELQRAALAGDPGALAVMRRLNPTWRPIIIPKGADAGE